MVLNANMPSKSFHKTQPYWECVKRWLYEWMIDYVAIKIDFLNTFVKRELD